MGTILGGSVTPIAMGIMSRSANRVGCTSASLIGLVFGIVAWLITAAKLNDGVISTFLNITLRLLNHQYDRSSRMFNLPRLEFLSVRCDNYRSELPHVGRQFKFNRSVKKS